MATHNNPDGSAPRDTKESRQEANACAGRFAVAALEGKLHLEPEDFTLAQRGFGRAMDSLNEVKDRWRELVDELIPLGDNPVGHAVARRFGEMSQQFFRSVRDYGDELGRSASALEQTIKEYRATDVANAQRFQNVGEFDQVQSTLALFNDELLDDEREIHDWVETLSDWQPGAGYEWSSHSSEELYGFGTVGNDPGRVESKIGRWASSAETLTCQSADLSGAVENLKDSWRGEAADSAHTALVPLARWGYDAGGNADRLRAQLARAGGAADELLRRIPPPAPEPAGMRKVMAGGVLSMTADMKVQREKADAVKAEQVRLLDEYTAVMSDVYDALPRFDIVPAAAKPGAEATSTSGGAGSVVPAMATGFGAPTPAGAPAPVATSEVGAAPSPGTGSAPTPSGSGSSQRTFSTGVTAPSMVDHPSPRAATSVPPGPTTGFGAGTAGPPGFGPGFGPGAGSGAVPRGVEARPRPGEPRTATPGSAGRNPLTAAAAPGRGPVPGHGGLAPTRTNREEDTEHTRPDYLLEEDPEGTFGTNEKTAPPVIGGAP